MVACLRHVLEECVGELGEIGAVPLHDGDGVGGVVGVGLAGFAGVLFGVGGFGWLDALIAELLLRFFLDVVEAEVGDGLGEVFDDVEGAVVVDDGDADRCGFGVEDVGAVDVGLHPGVVEVFQAGRSLRRCFPRRCGSGLLPGRRGRRGRARRDIGVGRRLFVATSVWRGRGRLAIERGRW